MIATYTPPHPSKPTKIIGDRPRLKLLSGQGNGAVIADAIRIVPSALSQTQSTSYYIHTDHLNTPRVIVNANNQRRWTWYPEQAEAFGANLPNENPTNLINGIPKQLGSFSYHLRFPGQLFNPATGLSYNYFRDYNPRMGRFHESDPIGLQGGVNTYGYANANPLSYTDPDGKFAIQLFYYGALGVATLATASWMAQHPVMPSGASANSDSLGMGGSSGALSSGSSIDDYLNPPLASRANSEEKLPIYNPGRDCNGDCIPCRAGKKWWVSKPGHGHKNGYWHTIIYNQDKKTCMCYPDRPSGGLEGF